MIVEDAYNQLANAILEFAGSAQWDVAGAKTSIWNRMTQSSYWRKCGDKVVENDRFPSFEIEGEASRAALYLRDNLLQTTGQRIWCLTFTLYPDGKFNIEYDYNKPEGYEESDETISLDEALRGLKNLGVKIEGDGQ